MGKWDILQNVKKILVYHYKNYFDSIEYVIFSIVKINFTVVKFFILFFIFYFLHILKIFQLPYIFLITQLYSMLWKQFTDRKGLRVRPMGRLKHGHYDCRIIMV